MRTSGSLRIGSYGGAPIWVRPETFLLSVLMVIPCAIRDPIAAICLALALFASILFHELGHAAAALRSRLHVHEIVHFGVAGFCSFEDPGRDVRCRCAIAAAGPLANLVIAFALMPVAALLDLNHRPGSIVAAAITMNIVLCFGNLVPVMPLDGGHILFALVEHRWSERRAILVTAGLGIVLIGPLTAFFIILTLVGTPAFLLTKSIRSNWRRFKSAWSDRPDQEIERLGRPPTSAERMMADILAEQSRRNARRREKARRAMPPDLD